MSKSVPEARDSGKAPPASAAPARTGGERGPFPWLQGEKQARYAS